MKILLVAPIVPWPLDMGNRTRVYNFLRELSTRHQVDAIFVADRSCKDLAAAEKELAQYCHSLDIVRQPNFNKLWRIVLSLRSRIAYYTKGIGNAEFYFNLKHIDATIREKLSGARYDLLFSNYWFTAIDAVTGSSCPRICDTHDVVWENVSRARNNGYRFCGQWFQKRHINRIKRQESAILNKFDGILCVSDRDRDTFRGELSVTSKSYVISLLREDLKADFRQPLVADDVLLFFGAMHSKMNIDAARFAALEIFPAIREKRPHARLVIAGSGAGPDVLKLGTQPGVTVIGYVPDLYELFHQAKVLLLPLRLGSGVKGRADWRDIWAVR